MSKNSILEHELVSKHEVMTKKDVAEMLDKYGIALENLPRIKEDDAAVIAIGAKKRDILRIVRNSRTAGDAVYYRMVV